MLVRHRVEQRHDTAVVVVEPKVRRRDDGAVGVALEQMREDAYEVARFLRLRGHEDLILQQLQQVGCERPARGELASDPIVLGRRSPAQPQVFGDVDLGGPLDLFVRDLQAVLEQTVEQQLLAVASGGRALEVGLDRSDAADLLKGVGVAVPYRCDQYEQLGVGLGDLGEELHDVERPRAPRVLLGVRQPVEPGLVLVENQRRRLAPEEFQQMIGARHVGLPVAESLPHAAHFRPVRVALEQKIPQELVALAVQALADDVHPVTQRERCELLVFATLRPSLQPSAGGGGVGEGVVQQRHQVRLALPAFPDEDERAAAARTHGFERLERVGGGVGQLEEIRCRHLRGAGVLRVLQLDRGAAETAPAELAPQCELQQGRSCQRPAAAGCRYGAVDSTLWQRGENTSSVPCVQRR